VSGDLDRPCPHEDFDVNVEVNRLADHDGGPITGYSADIRVQCAACGEPFRWIGVPAGLSPRGPMCSIDETKLRAPLRPASADPDFGLGLPGFAVHQVLPDTSLVDLPCQNPRDLVTLESTEPIGTVACGSCLPCRARSHAGQASDGGR
jgi:hypothetical protein